jgi:hypothetical protein
MVQLNSILHVSVHSALRQDVLVGEVGSQQRTAIDYSRSQQAQGMAKPYVHQKGSQVLIAHQFRMYGFRHCHKPYCL